MIRHRICDRDHLSPAASPALQPFPPAIAGIQVVPELDVLLILLPAQEYLFPADDRREIDQPTGDVLHLDFPALEFLQYLLQARERPYPFVDHVAAQIAAWRHQSRSEEHTSELQSPMY